MGDVVVRFNGVDVADLNHLINLVSMAPIGQPADVTVWRDRREVPVRVTVADKERIIVANARTARSAPPANTVEGVEFMTLDASTARRMGLPETMRGAAVMNVDPASPLASYPPPIST